MSRPSAFLFVKLLEHCKENSIKSLQLDIVGHGGHNDGYHQRSSFKITLGETTYSFDVTANYCDISGEDFDGKLDKGHNLCCIIGEVDN